MRIHTFRTHRGVHRAVCFAVPAVAAVLVAFQVSTSAQQAGAPAPKPGVLPGAVTESMFAAQLKFHGANDCSNAKCHGAPMPVPNGPPFYDEFTKWSGGQDPHQAAFESLGGNNPKGKKGQEIYAKYKALNAAAAKEANATESQKCLTCHGLAAPKPLQGPNFNVQEGVTCGSCHGPYQKWADPHGKKVGNEWWAAAERKATGTPDKFWQKWGLYDTKNVQARADKCTSCHLSIDPAMVEAGHPQPTFELNTYSASYPGRHWRQEEGYFGVKLWAVGQAVSLRDAMYQLAERAGAAGAKPASVEQAYNQAMAHLTVFTPLLTSGAVNAPPASVKGINDWGANLKSSMAAKNNAAVAAAAKNLALYAVQLTPAVAAINPNKAATVSVLNAVTGSADLPKMGKAATEQQTAAIYSLYAGMATSPDKPADADAVLDLITKPGNLYPAEGKTEPEPNAYKKALGDIKAKLPK